MAQVFEVALRKKRRYHERLTNFFWEEQERCFIAAASHVRKYREHLRELEMASEELLPYRFKPKKARIEFNNSNLKQ